MSNGDRSTAAGATLVELLVTVAILGVMFVVFTGGTASSILGSDIHRKQAAAEAVLRSFAEAVKAEPYDQCADGTALSSATGGAPPAGYTKATPAVKAWNGAAFVDCPTADTQGLQLVSLEVRSDDGRAVETVDVLKRRP